MRDYNRPHYRLYAKENYEIVQDPRTLTDLALTKPLVIICNLCPICEGEGDFMIIRLSSYTVPEDSVVRYIIQKIEYGETTEIVDLDYGDAEKWLNAPLPSFNVGE